MNKNKNLIAIHSKMGGGKDTVANIIHYLVAKQIYKNDDSYIEDILDKGFNPNMNYEEVSSYETKRFADPIKDFVCILIGCTREQLEDREFKEKELGPEWWYYTYEIGHNYERTLKKVSYNEYNMNPMLYPFEMISLFKHTPRTLMQLIGTEAGREIIHPDIWCNALFSGYKEHVVKYTDPRDEAIYGRGVFDETDYPQWIIADLRFPNEVEAVNKRQGVTIKVERPISQRHPAQWKKYRKNSQHPPNEQGFKKWLKENNVDLYNKITHESENALDNYTDFDFTIVNDGSLEELEYKIEKILKELEII